MTSEECDELRDEIRQAASAAGLLMEEIEQYWKFWRGDRGRKGPLLYVGKKRTVVHIKRISPPIPGWTFIPRQDPKHVGDVYEIRLEGDAATVRRTFKAGLERLLSA